MKCQDLKLKTICENGNTFITNHRVWDKAKFIKSRNDAGLKAYQSNDGSGFRVEVVK